MKEFIKSIPLIGPLIKTINRRIKGTPTFETSAQYWEERYQKKGNSGAGSYQNLAIFKAEVINSFVSQNEIKSVIEFGSGDGNQLKYFNFQTYEGFDISSTAIEHCKKLYASDPSKSFATISSYAGQKADLAMSLDVIYHLVEDAVFHDYMNRLFGASNRYIIVYSSNYDDGPSDSPSHVRHRRFTDWVDAHAKGFGLIEHIPNKYPYNGNGKVSSLADFYIFEKKV